PRMKVSADLRSTGTQPPQDGRCPLAGSHLIRREIGCPHPEPLEQRVEARELADVLDRHAVAVRLPVVFLRIDGDDQQNRSWHGGTYQTRAGSCRARSRELGAITRA